MQPSPDAIALVKASEGLRLIAYPDAAGVWTIGWGHTDGVNPGMRITEQEAENFLAADLAVAGDAVSSLVKVPLTQGQFDALSDFVFNLGAGRLMNSTLLRLLNEGNYQAAAKQFPMWCMAAGRPEPGLVKRRAAERALFIGKAA
jgi:lysozyme